MHRIIEHIYDAASDNHAWSAVLEDIAHLTCSKSAVLLYQDHEVEHASTFASYGLDPQWLVLYNEKYGGIDPTLEVIASVPTGELIATHHVEYAEQIYQSQTYKEFYQPQNIFHLAGTWLIRNRYRSALLGFQRGKDAPEYTLDVLSHVRDLVPHFQKALHIYRTHTEAVVRNDAFAMGIDTMQMGIIFFDHQGQVSYCNKSAENMIGYHPAIEMRDHNIYATTLECNQRIREAIAAAALGSLNSMPVKPVAIGLRHHSTFAPLPVLITPIHQSKFSPLISRGSVAAVMTLTDPEQMAITSPELLATIYDLTKTEADIAVGLANAMSAKELAAKQGVQLATVRTHIQNIFTKMGVTSQAQLIKTLLHSPLSSLK